MAGRVTLIPILCAASLAGTSWAQLADPTRPPALPDVATAPGDAGTAKVTGGLQTVILKKDGIGRSAAVIDGQVVQLGGRLGEARLVRVEEDHVILLGAEGRETLRLMPATEKQISKKVGAGGTARKAADR